MDLTQGIAQMQSQLKPDMFGAAAEGSNDYSTAIKNGQQIASNRIANENAEYQKQLQQRLQQAISESIDPVSGQPDYDKLAVSGHKYGIDAQTMDYSIKHIKENWDALASSAMNKQQAQSTVTPSSYANINASTVPSSGSTWATAKPVAKQPEPVQSSTLGVAPVQTQVQADQTGSAPSADSLPATAQDQGKQMDLGAMDISTFKTPSPDQPAPVAPADPFAVKPGEEPKAPSKNFYQLVNQADVQNPFGAQGGGVGGNLSTGLFPRETPPQNTKTTNETLNPSEDFAGNTRLLLSSSGFNTGDYNADYNAALDAASDAVLAKMPIAPMKTGNYAKDIEAMNTYRNEVRKVQSEAYAARNSLKKDISEGNFKRADATLKDMTNTITLDGTKYRAVDGPARATALALVPVKTEIPTYMKDLDRVPNNDRAGLGMMLARGARLYASAMNPGAQVSEGSLSEVGRQVFGEEGDDLKRFVIGGLAAFKADGINGLAEFANGLVAKYDGASIKERLKDMSHGADKAITNTLRASLVGYGGKDPSERSDYKPEATVTDTPVLKTGWYDRKPGEKLFESATGNQYKVTGRDALGYPNEAIDRNNSKYTIKDAGNGVTLEEKGWASEKPASKGKGRAKETAAERFKRLSGGK